MSGRKIRSKNIKLFRKYVTIIVGSILMAAAINLIYEPLGLVTGGIAGLAIVVKEITKFIWEGGLPIWIFTVIVNIPLFIIAIKLLGLKTMFNVFIGTVSLIIALMIIPIYDFQFNDILLSSVVGGAISGVGMGMVFSASASTGGTDLLATLIHRYKRHISVPFILTFIDGAIIVLGALVFGIGKALYAIIAVFITAKVSDGILEGLKFAKMAYIISDEYIKIADEIMTTLDRGVTGLSSTGMYSNKDRKMLFCVVSKNEIVKITEIAKKIDPNSFVIVNDVREVMGEGFIEYRQ
ncbi:MAG: YitT family protein [Anaerolineaceae bacterium]|nr:MAG: YitT family protein [Anaerolineaceae bacterium]